MYLCLCSLTLTFLIEFKREVVFNLFYEHLSEMYSLTMTLEMHFNIDKNIAQETIIDYRYHDLCKLLNI